MELRIFFFFLKWEILQKVYVDGNNLLKGKYGCRRIQQELCLDNVFEYKEGSGLGV